MQIQTLRLSLELQGAGELNQTWSATWPHPFSETPAVVAQVNGAPAEARCRVAIRGANQARVAGELFSDFDGKFELVLIGVSD